MKKGRIIAILVLLAAIGMMAYAGIKLAKVERVYREANSAYDSLSAQIRKEMPAGTSAAGTPGTGVPSAADGAGGTDDTAAGDPALAEDAPSVEIDFGTLETISKDATTWLYCPGTMIDYPVMKASDYYYYLRHLPDGTENANGSLFIDYNNAADFSEALTVIYGHAMRSGAMFGSLSGYKGQAYYNAHPTMYLYTKNGDYRIDLLYGCVIGAGKWRDRAFMYAENVDSLVSYAAHNTTFRSTASYTKGDRVVAMSTCSYEFDGARYVVLGVLRRI